MNEPQILKEDQISNETQIKNEPQILKVNKILKETQITNKPKNFKRSGNFQNNPNYK